MELPRIDFAIADARSSISAIEQSHQQLIWESHMSRIVSNDKGGEE